MAKKKRTYSMLDLIKANGKPVPNVAAQSTRLCSHRNDPYAVQIKAATEFVKNEKNYIIDRIVIRLLISSGLRISEVLSLKAFDIAADGSILIRSKKGSNIRYISGMEFSSFLGINAVWFCSELSCRNRWHYYRLIKRLGISVVVSGNSNASVTHLFRYAFVERIIGLSGSVEESAQIVGHKNKKNTGRYFIKSTGHGKK